MNAAAREQQVEGGAGVAVIVSTHTPRHLRRVLIGVAVQRPRAGWVVVSSDTLDDSILGCVRECSGEFGMGIGLVMRPHTDKSRSSQVRNNGVRWLLARDGATDAVRRARLVFLDGDICLLPGAIARHIELGRDAPGDAGSGKLVIGFRVELSEEQTERFDETAILDGQAPASVTAEQAAALKRRHRRYVRQAWMARLGLGKAHKPKLLSANFSVPFAWYERVNGFDEEYEGYGQEDDDLGRRLYLAGCRAAVGVATIPAVHLYHPTRAPGDWEASPNAVRFLEGVRARTVRCARGLVEPLDQPAAVSVLMKDGKAEEGLR